MIHLRGFTKPAVLANVHHAVFSAELQTWLDLLYQKLYKERKVWDFINVFPSVISVLDTLVQILHRMRSRIADCK